MLLVTSNLLSGIGQVMNKYKEAFHGTLVSYNDDISVFKDETVFVFLIPVPSFIEKIKQVKQVAKFVFCMTVCETETVHEDYKYIFDIFDMVFVPSDFCNQILSRQYPNTKFITLRHTIPQCEIVPRSLTNKKYVFYHIGNIIDPRKQVHKIIQAFKEINLPDTQLILKATCNHHVSIKEPNVLVMNGLFSDDQMNMVHNLADCYVSFSHSEGVGMGAVEAAVRDKPVILQEYGGCKEYVKTPYTIECKRTKIQQDDFLFLKGQEWGDPNYNQLKLFMIDAWTKKLRYMDHSYTRSIVSHDSVKACLLQNLPQLELTL